MRGCVYTATGVGSAGRRLHRLSHPFGLAPSSPPRPPPLPPAPLLPPRTPPRSLCSAGRALVVRDRRRATALRASSSRSCPTLLVRPSRPCHRPRLCCRRRRRRRRRSPPAAHRRRCRRCHKSDPVPGMSKAATAGGRAGERRRLRSGGRAPRALRVGGAGVGGRHFDGDPPLTPPPPLEWAPRLGFCLSGRRYPSRPPPLSPTPPQRARTAAPSGTIGSTVAAVPHARLCRQRA